MKLLEYNKICEKKYEITLNNGLKVIIIPKKGFRRFLVGLQINFGSRVTKFKIADKTYELPKGVAHFLEHKMFSRPNEKDVSDEFSSLGLDCNAYTNTLSTLYFFSGLSNLDKGINLLLDFVQNPFFTSENVEKEKEIIKQELFMYQDDPSNVLYQGIKQCLYANYPIIYDVCGDENGIMAINKDILYFAHKTFYHPSNMTLVVCGDVDPQRIKEVVEENQNHKVFSKPDKYEVLFEEDINLNQKKRSITMDIAIPKVSVGIKLITTQSSEKNVKVREETLIRLFFGCLFGTDTKFYQNMVDKKIICGNYNSSVYVDDNVSFYALEVDTNNPDEYVRLVKGRIYNFKKFNFTEELIERKKKLLYGLTMGELNSIESEALAYFSYLSSNADLFEYFSIIDSITMEDVKKIGTLIDKNAIGVFSIYPNN